MYLIRKSRVCLWALIPSLMAFSGCGLQSNSTPVSVNNEPIQKDQAMQYRNWAQSPAYYANGAVVAGSTRFFLEPSQEVDPRLAQAAELPLFAANVVFWPITYFLVPPCAPVLYRGAVAPPSYNANPPLPAPVAQ